MGNCTNCGHAIFDPIYGDYKCNIYEITIYKPDTKIGCERYEKGTPITSKVDETYMIDKEDVV